MDSYHITTRHAGNMAFDATIGQHVVRMDTVPEQGGDDTGSAPKKLLLGTLATCTGMDVVALLEKMHVSFSDFSMETFADLADEHPKVFTRVEILYKIKVQADDQAKVEKAVSLSQEKYCGISAMLRKNSPLDFRIEFL